jgi:hypothetical protein
MEEHKTTCPATKARLYALEIKAQLQTPEGRASINKAEHEIAKYRKWFNEAAHISHEFLHLPMTI